MTTLSLTPSSSASTASVAAPTVEQDAARRDVCRWAEEARALGLSRAALFLTFAESEMVRRLANVRANKTEPARPSPFIYIFQ